MNRNDILKKIVLKAKRDERNRRDPRYIEVMGFLVAKGLLHTNQTIPRLPNKKIKIEDAIWAGTNVEPRILEVLPAAVLRLQNHFFLKVNNFPELNRAVESLKMGTRGQDFFGVPYEKYQVWAELPLPDKRMKSPSEKRIVKTFRLTPQVAALLRKRSQEIGCSETEIIERAILR